MHHVTGSILYSLVTCPQRVALDTFGDQSKRDPVSPFVQLLWDRGNLFERDTIGRLMAKALRGAESSMPCQGCDSSSAVRT